MSAVGESEEVVPKAGRPLLRVFPARRAPPPEPVRLEDASADEAACFYQEGKKADHACAYSGRFMSELRTVHVGDETYSFDAIRSFRQAAIPGKFHDRVIRWDRIAANIAFIPLLFFVVVPYLFFITVPVALTMAVIAGRKRRTVYGNERGFLVATWVCSFVQVGVGVLFWMLIAAELGIIG